MTITLRARVASTARTVNVGKAYYATAHARDSDDRMHAGRMSTADSWPEAMQAAHKMLRDLDAELMAEVHASRASRRATAPSHAALVTTQKATA